MEVYAGFQENTDAAVGEVVKAIENMGIADNTLVIYIWGRQRREHGRHRDWHLQ